MKNNALLQQLALAKQAGTKAMAKDFFAKTPGPGAEPGAEGTPPVDDVQTSAPGDAQAGEQPEPGEKSLDLEANGQDMTPEQLEELLRMLEAQGGGQG